MKKKLFLAAGMCIFIALLGVTAFFSKKAVVLPKAEIELSKKLYMQLGKGEAEAQKLAVQGAKKRNALYQEALANGYACTEEEVEEYVTTLMEEIGGPEEDEGVRLTMNYLELDGEEEFRQYLLETYKKNLPAQNYVNDLQLEYSRINKGGAGDLTWQEKLNEIRDEAVKKYRWIEE